MSKNGQEMTRSLYRSLSFVDEYAETNDCFPKLAARLERLTKDLKGEYVLDLGCGPGRDARRMNKLGCKAVGVDYSHEMVKKAESLNVGSINPLYIVADMRDIGSLFAENTFAAAWCTASLIHIPVNETDKVLAGLRRVTKPGSLTYIGLKGGPTETKIVTENKYNLSIVREFTFWEKEDFAQLVRESGFSIFDYDQEISGLTDNKPTSWLNFTIRNEK